MWFHASKLSGAILIEPEPLGDERGFFMRTFCVREFAGQGLEVAFVQHSMSLTAEKGTIRGMHFQRPPNTEVKLVRCLKGAIYDVIVDLRTGSPTHGHWQGFELTAENRHQLYLPKHFAHGFQTLTPDAEVGYLISDFYSPSAASGVRYDDAAFGIEWPLPITVISEKDQAWPDYDGTGI